MILCNILYIPLNLNGFIWLNYLGLLRGIACHISHFITALVQCVSTNLCNTSKIPWVDNVLQPNVLYIVILFCFTVAVGLCETNQLQLSILNAYRAGQQPEPPTERRAASPKSPQRAEAKDYLSPSFSVSLSTPQQLSWRILENCKWHNLNRYRSSSKRRRGGGEDEGVEEEGERRHRDTRETQANTEASLIFDHIQ